MKKLINLLSIFLVLAALAACKYAKIVPDVPSPTTPVSFATDIQPIFNTSGCIGCHKPGGPTPNLTAGNSYQSLISNGLVIAGNAVSSVLYQEVSTGSMSAYPDATQVALIQNWINQGAKNN
jgi:mono/diheme cytochrome c family protein